MTNRFADFRPTLPPAYVQFIESHDGWEGDLGNVIGYVVIWDRRSIQARWIDYEMATSLSNRWFPFGSDGGGEMLCFDLTSGTDRVFWISYIGMSDQDVVDRQISFADIVAAIPHSA